MKRLLDVVLSVCALLLSLPTFLVVGIVNRCYGNDCFFRQRRIGRDAKPFFIWKLATMDPQAHINGGTITVHDDPRITPLGHILRRWKINELPQFANVLFGEMSVVGPRPISCREIGLYPLDILPEVFAVTPGITGWGSLFFHDEERLLRLEASQVRPYYASEILPRKAALEIWYVRNRTLALDLQIVLATALAVSLGRVAPGIVLPGIVRWMRRRTGPLHQWIFEESADHESRLDGDSPSTDGRVAHERE